MQNFFRKRQPSSDAEQNPSKRRRPTADDEDDAEKLRSPRVIVGWNCNGLSSRLRGGDADAIKDFVTKYEPDVIFLSEVRLPAANNCPKGKPGPHTKWYRSRVRDSEKKALEDLSLVNRFLFSKPMSKYKVYFSLADTKYAGTAMLLNTATMRAPLGIRYNLEGKDVKSSVHDPDGRVIVVRFEDFTVLHTYSPNNGWEDDHFARRFAWDKKVHSFMERKRVAGVKIMWVGDLNVAPKDVDLSHAEYFRKQVGGRYAKVRVEDIAPENVGQPGCTNAERERFFGILAAGDMVDAYRELIGNDDESALSWRGNTTGKHSGRGMRIDHCIIGRSLLPSISSVEITGHGSDRVGFLGSDHCPVLIKMREKDGGNSDSPQDPANAELRTV